MSSGPSSPSRCSGDGSAVSPSRKQTSRRGRGQRAPHGVALAQRRSVLGEQRVLLKDSAPQAAATAAVPSGEAASITRTSIHEPGAAQRLDCLAQHAADRLRALLGRDQDCDAPVSPGPRRGRRDRSRRRQSGCARATARPPGRPTARARRGRQLEPRCGPGRRWGAGRERRPGPAGSRRRRPPGPGTVPGPPRAVGPGGDPDRGAGEVVMARGRVTAAHPDQAALGVAGAAREHGGGQRGALVGVELDQPGDRLGPVAEVGELALEPVRRRRASRRRWSRSTRRAAPGRAGARRRAPSRAGGRRRVHARDR